MLQFIKEIFKANIVLYKDIFLYFQKRFLKWKHKPSIYDFNAHCCYCGEFLARSKTGSRPQNCKQPFVTFWGPANKVPKQTITLCEKCYEENVDEFTKESLKNGVRRKDLFKCTYCKSVNEQFKMTSIQYYDPGTDLVRAIDICNECYFPIYRTVKGSAADVGKYLPEHNPNKIVKSEYY